MKKELLAPVGSFDALKYAIHNGADAVYLGGKKFGARAFASNFDDAEMIKTIRYCHLYGVKIYVTVNTMIYESELESAINYVGFLYQNHVDAVIMADYGLMDACHKRYPDLVIHASTQAHTHHVSQINFLKSLGVKRVVLARELSLEEINKFPKDLEIEVFIHGALCISYSGQCLFSSFLMNRSGNRGECAQICRLPFSLIQDDEKIALDENYLLSTKDLNTSHQMSNLMNSNITSFKIEGRMKSPYYVGYITRMYRRLMDENQQRGTATVTIEEDKNARNLFSRGFTEGHLFLKKNQDLMNQKSSNHQGTFLGEIIEVNKKQIKIKLSEDIHQEDGIRFISEDKGMIVNFLYNQKGLLINNAKKGDIILIDNKVGLTKVGDVFKTIDHVLEQNIGVLTEKKIKVQINAEVTEKSFKLIMSDGIHEVMIEEEIVYQAKNQPITKEKIVSQLSKLGNSIYIADDITVRLEDNLFINIKDINEIRRKAVEMLDEQRIYREEVRITNPLEEKRFVSKKKTCQIFAKVATEEQLKTLLELGIDGIYVSDVELYQKYQNERVIMEEARVYSKLNEKDIKEILVSETGALSTYQNEKITNYFMNVANHHTVELFQRSGAKRVTLSVEMSEEEIILLSLKTNVPLEVLVYGKIELMYIHHCILRMNVNHEKICQVCKKHSYFLEDRNGKRYPIVVTKNHDNVILSYKPIERMGEVPILKEHGITSYRMDFYDEEKDTIVKLVTELKNVLYS